ncbi:hypothetical protein EDC01DRAFT_762444 [Geopyxis carbonaria]|nr:hypothetical protein EDC01DRAFT_762444 [Geopyxis carbonaria]
MSFEPPPESTKKPKQPPEPEKVEYDEFGLPIKKPRRPAYVDDDDDDDGVSQVPEVKPKLEQKPPSPTIPAVKIEATTVLETKETDNSTPPPAPPPYEVKARRNNRDSLMSLPEEDRKKNEVKMFSENPNDPHMQTGVISEWSHQQIVPRDNKNVDQDKKDESEDEWQAMPAYATHDMWDDDGRLIAKARDDSGDEDDGQMAGAAKGYTRVFDDEDADSVTSMDENTKYLFNENEDDEASRNPLSQMQATKDLLTEGQRIAYVGVCRLALSEMTKDLQKRVVKGRTAKKNMTVIVENMRMWTQKMMVRLYTHMELSPPEQIMIEQLTEHGVIPSDMTPMLMKNTRVLNPNARQSTVFGDSSPQRQSVYSSAPGTPVERRSRASLSPSLEAPPAYEDVELQEVKDPSQLPTTKTLDIDLRWTVLCDLFLVLIADSVYDARARTLLERVGVMLDVPWTDICKFEKRVTDALEMQESTEQNWTESEHIANRDKAARNKRFMMLGLATVGGGLVIGLSGGLLAPMIGAGLAAGFTTIGVAGTSGFLAGTGGTALIASGAVLSGSVVGGRAGFNRMKSVSTFEFKPLHNAKRVNLIITVSGWMNGKVDDVRLPYSTVDPIMGDLFSIHWEPEMLQSMGQTINILATEVLTQSLQQVLGSTILVALMASLQLPIVLTKLSYLLDNPWSVSLDRAQAAGLILADTLIHRNLGVRPVTLVGYSLGARVIYSCLQELARVGATGLVQNAYLFGSPVVVKKDDYSLAVSVVSGRFVNGYATNDWILGYLFRATSGGIGRVAGLAPVQDIPGVENVDVTELVPGHMAYRQAMPKLLRRVGWEVTSDEFAEIEDPDPDNHKERQRELINELDEARKELEKQPQKKKLFGFFSRKDAAKKKDWETYEPGSEGKEQSRPEDGSSTPGGPDANKGVLFDIDAIRAELAKDDKSEEIVQVKEIESTLPKLRISTDGNNDPSGSGYSRPGYDTLRQTKSSNDVSSAYGYEGRGYGSFDLQHDHLDDDGRSVMMSFEPEPSLSRTYTAPPAGAAGAGDSSRNIWADYDEYDEFAPRDEGEMTMTFA